MKESDWPNPAVASAGNYTTTTGPTGVKMEAPYEWVAPVYWEIDTKRGGAFGFATEISPGPAIRPSRACGACCGGPFVAYRFRLGVPRRRHVVHSEDLTEALDKRYGPSHSVEEYAQKAQMQAFEGHRAMMEAYGRNKYGSTGVIQ